jgi:hypothetical protein
MKEALVGTWLLVSQHTLMPDGTRVADRGEGAQGILMYDADGYMSVQLMRTDERAGEFTDLSDFRTAMEGYHAYFGRYEVDEAAGIVRHLVTGSAYMPYRGSTQVRGYSLDGDTLTLRSDSKVDGLTRLLVWQRARP